jgi:hypothetical protein
MSLLLDYIHTHPKETKRLIGITLKQFKQLVNLAEIANEQLNIEIEKHKTRVNVKGAGSPRKLSVSDQILLTLDYLRQFETFQSLGVKFEVSESTAHNIFHKWLPILVSLLPASLLEQVNDKPGDLEWVKEILCNYELIVDSTEQPIERPLDKSEQKKFYSGYKRMHTMKGQFIILPNGQDIVDCLIGQPGPTSDINLFQERECIFEIEQKFKADNGYLGSEKITTPPHRKPKQGELSEEQKKENKSFSSSRIFVEHIIRNIKIFKIARERFRLRRNIYEQVILAICGLVRLRINALILSS